MNWRTNEKTLTGCPRGVIDIRALFYFLTHPNRDDRGCFTREVIMKKRENSGIVGQVFTPDGLKKKCRCSFTDVVEILPGVVHVHFFPSEENFKTKVTSYSAQ
jgi:hypothetical protein